MTSKYINVIYTYKSIKQILTNNIKKYNIDIGSIYIIVTYKSIKHKSIRKCEN